MFLSLADFNYNSRKYQNGTTLDKGSLSKLEVKNLADSKWKEMLIVEKGTKVMDFMYVFPSLSTRNACAPSCWHFILEDSCWSLLT